MYKKRILLVNEASYLNTGFSNYGLEVMRRLYSTNKYELAELATYVDSHDNRNFSLPWKVYANLPDNDEERSRYNVDSDHQFGSFKFEKTCLDFRPDIIFNILDPFMIKFLFTSPFRRHFYFSYMPTVDAIPQNEEWIDQYTQANAIFAYNDWSLDVLKQCGGGKINIVRSAPPGASIKELKVIENKEQHRKNFGIKPDAFIVGTVMRNQKRKLYPNLIDAFRDFVSKLSPEKASKAYLYIHCGYPEIGWNIPNLIKHSGISSKILFTYICRACNKWFPAPYQDAKTACKYCDNVAAMLPNTQIGLDRINMHYMISLFDAYVQYAIFEGFGMPQTDAAVAGVPVFSVDYSAMTDVVRKLKGFPIRVNYFNMEAETGRQMAIPDNAHLVDELKKFSSLPESMRKIRGIQTRKLCEKHYDWDKTAKVWEEHFDSVRTLDHSKTWRSPTRYHYIDMNCPQNMTNQQFVNWALTSVAGRPDLCNTFAALQLTKDLNWGATTAVHGQNNFNDQSMLGSQRKLQEFDRQKLLDICVNMCNHRNYWEEQREASNSNNSS